MADTQLIGLDEELSSWRKVISEVPHLKYAGDKILRKPCLKVTQAEFDSGEVKKWNQLMIKTLTDVRRIMGFGRGLAANQVGFSKQMIVTFEKDIFQTYINPEVIEESELRAMYGELCLSFVLVMGDIVRPYWLTIKYLNPEGQEKIEKVEGVKARLLGHELDHLQGKLCLDGSVPNTLRVISGGKTQVFEEKLKVIK